MLTDSDSDSESESDEEICKDLLDLYKPLERWKPLERSNNKPLERASMALQRSTVPLESPLWKPIERTIDKARDLPIRRKPDNRRYEVPAIPAEQAERHALAQEQLQSCMIAAAPLGPTATTEPGATVISLFGGMGGTAPALKATGGTPVVTSF